MTRKSQNSLENLWVSRNETLAPLTSKHQLHYGKLPFTLRLSTSYLPTSYLSV